MSTTTSSGAAATTGVRPFRVDIPKEALVDLRNRLAATRRPDSGDGR